MTTDNTPDPEVLVLQHLLEDGPGYLGQWLDAQGVRWRVLCTEAGDAYPATLGDTKGLAVLGGAWGANDERSSLRQAETLIREADARGIPVLGHCLGGQLIARALGGRVARLPQPEIGWLPIQRADSAAAREWLGDGVEAVVYQWHEDGFVELPPGAELLASSPRCAHQAFALRQHLAMQFHIEVTPEKITDWLEHPGDAYPVRVLLHRDSVQDPATQRTGTAVHLAASQTLAGHIYSRWRERWRP